MTTVQPKRLKEILNHFEGQEIIVVGDIMLDHFIKGTVSRISPEAPVPVVDVKRNFCSRRCRKRSRQLGGLGGEARTGIRRGAGPGR